MKPQDNAMTSRKATRLRFLEQESDHLFAYKIDLEKVLTKTKEVLNDLLSAKVYSSSQQLDGSCEDTASTSNILFKSVEVTAAENMELFNSICKAHYARDTIDAKVLISQQITEEYSRKEEEILGELDEQINDLKYLLEKKVNRINLLNSKVKDMEDHQAKLNSECTLLLPLNSDSLKVHVQMEYLKEKLLKRLKELQFCEMQKDELKVHAAGLEEKIRKYLLLVKNPLLKKKKYINAQENSQENIIVDSLNASNSCEAIFPDNFLIEAEKGIIPNLDYGSLHQKDKVSIIDINSGKSRIREKVKEMQAMCSKKSEDLNNLRQLVRDQDANIKNLVSQIKFLTEESSEQENVNNQRKRKKAMSNPLEYLSGNNEEIQNKIKEMPKIQIYEAENIEDMDEEEDYYPNELVSFIASDVAKCEFEEPDSLLVGYINEIH
ncbi:unnamed protein product [Blepharisma stoltei]|uniref:Uncharacterized protein n=1 Tax=Blepharisma stoltei TaxID=1481888 RepID=A0AAU9JIG1_9CILI|nr:unnamed protein product [Blepharisma stoltei]